MPHEDSPQPSVWPFLSTAYVDEYGPINPDVHATAGKLWPTAQILIRQAQVDFEEGQALMFRAVAQVTRMMDQRTKPIENLAGYLWVTFRHLLLEEIKTRARHSTLDAEYVARSTPGTNRSENEIIESILISEIRELADDWLREVIELCLLGHSFEEIANLKRVPANSLRSKFSKKIKKLVKHIEKKSKEQR
jgi:DNA-directed RNA polymerase specialized sigma24 family protein